jgi:His/Glu/Gln/Arg/opine family amino acid ABC transporter permease subunit
MMQSIPFMQQFGRIGMAFLINLAFMPIVLLIGVVVGLAVSIARFYRVPFLAQVLKVLTELIRGSPFLLLVYATYFILPYLGVSLNAFASGVVVLSITSTAFLSEIFLSGLRTIDQGQYHASEAMGIGFLDSLLYIIFPQMWRITIPSIVGQIVMIIKDTTIVSLVGLTEIVRTSRQISLLTLDPFTSFGIVAIYFFAICYPLIRVSKRLERRLKRNA